MQPKALILIKMPVIVQEKVKPKHLAAHSSMRRLGKTLSDSLRDVKAYALGDTIPDTVPEANA